MGRYTPVYKKWSFLLKIFLVNVNKCAMYSTSFRSETFINVMNLKLIIVLANKKRYIKLSTTNTIKFSESCLSRLIQFNFKDDKPGHRST